MTYNMPDEYIVSENETLLDVLDRRVQSYPNFPLIEYKVTGEHNSNLLASTHNATGENLRTEIGSFVSVSALEFQIIVEKVAKGLINLGVNSGDKVIISAHTSIEWILLDFAVFSVGAITVPVYETSSVDQIKYIISNSESSFAFVENEELKNKFEAAHPNLSIRVFEKNAVRELIALGQQISTSELDSRKDDLNADSIASIVYTSGSTGTPKGVILDHKAYVSLAYNAGFSLPEALLSNGAKLLLFLPLAHGFARLVAFAMIASNKTVLGLSPNIKDLLSDLKVFKPTVLLGVPRIFEKVFNAASHKAGTGAGQIVFQRAVKSAVEWSKLQNQTGEIDFKSKFTIQRKNASRLFYDPIVYSKIREVLGGQVRFAVCGGAPLNEEIGHFFKGVGIDILEGFGMTETVAPITVNRPDNNKIGTIGLPFPGVEIRITDDGEMFISSPSNFLGYKNDQSSSNATLISDGEMENKITRGEIKFIKSSNDIFPIVKERKLSSGKIWKKSWIASGDLADFDDQGFIRITGRKKDLIVTAGGKNVSPSPLESLIDVCPLVANSVVIGDGEPFISALITLDRDELKNWSERNSVENISIEKAIENSAIIAEIQRFVDLANASVSQAESIRKFLIIENEFSEDDGTLTPSMKIRRHKIEEKYSTIIKEKIYK